MMRRGRGREALRVCRAAWLVGVTVSEYREFEAGERSPRRGDLASDLRRARVPAELHPMIFELYGVAADVQREVTVNG